MSKLLSWSSFGVLPKDPPTYFTVSLSFIKILTQIHFFWFDSLLGLWEIFGPMLFGLLEGPFNALSGHSPHFSWGVNFISSKFITLTNYLRCWALVAPITGVRFFLDLCPFLLEVIGAIDSYIFPFLDHLKLTQELFPLDIVACVPPFM
jgi:hypothetical protein